MSDEGEHPRGFWGRLGKWQRRIALIASVLAMLTAPATLVWGAYQGAEQWVEEIEDRLERTEQLAESNLRNILWGEYLELDKRRLTVGLSPSQYRRFCSLGRDLEAFTTCPPRNPRGGE